MFTEWRKLGESGERRVSEWLDAQRSRMYDIGIFMKIVKQWFTTEYNRRNGHKGTLWESVYFDRSVPLRESEMAKCLAYIHLNPIRAAESDKFDGYTWSSYSAFRKGDPTSTAGMRFIYGNKESDDAIANRHEFLLEELLEKEKLRRAEEIARKRAAGYEVPPDPLTDEALVAQRAAHLAEVQKASVELHEERNYEKRRGKRCALREQETLALLASNPEMNASLLSERLNVSVRTAYHVLKQLKDKGIIHQEDGRWRINLAK
jgi:predicted transcriptional regulator